MKFRVDEIADFFHTGIEHFGDQNDNRNNDDDGSVCTVQLQHDNQKKIDQ